jgi:hypothetical protein
VMTRTSTRSTSDEASASARPAVRSAIPAARGANICRRLSCTFAGRPYRPMTTGSFPRERSRCRRADSPDAGPRSRAARGEARRGRGWTAAFRRKRGDGGATGHPPIQTCHERREGDGEHPAERGDEEHMRERCDHVDEQPERDEDPKEREHRDEEIRRPPVHERWKSPAPRREAREPAPR